MLQFEEKFFEEEERCGFLIPAMMKRVWAAEMEVLSQIVMVCEKYQLQYFADYGTLLGAVRHHGFIPWDDDIDITLKRKDYQKLMQILPKELPEGYQVNSIYTSRNHNALITTVTNAETIPLEREKIEEFYGCPYIVGVDIYPLDYLPKDEKMAETQLQLYNVVYDLVYRYEEIKKQGNVEYYMRLVEEMCAVTIDRKNNPRNQLWLLCDRIGSLATEEESDCITFFPRRVMGDLKFRFNKEWYAKSIVQPFENMQISIPQNYHEVLSMIYGDYHTPVFGPSGHDYPFYAGQEAFLQSLKN